MAIGEHPSAALVERIRNGSREAEEELIARYGRGVRFLIGRSLSNRATAEDVYQETFLIALEKIRAGEVREPERLSGFICSLAKNVATGNLRQALRRSTRETSSPETPDPALDPNQLEGLVNEERALLARRVLDDLPSGRDREVLRRFYLADEDKEAICAALGVSGLHFNQILFRARARFRRLFEEVASRKK